MLPLLIGSLIAILVGSALYIRRERILQQQAIRRWRFDLDRDRFYFVHD